MSQLQLSTLSEAELVSAARAGDQDAFAEIYKRHHRYVLAVCRRRLGFTDADDLAQDTWVNVWRGIAQFEGRSSLRTWLSRCATFGAGKAMRRAQQPTNGYGNLVCLGEMGALEALAVSESKDVQAAVDRLDCERFLTAMLPGDAEVMRLHYLEELSNEELAATLGIGLASAKAKLHRARVRVRETLGLGLAVAAES